MKIAPLRIGELDISVPLLLAPMAGYTRLPFRAICKGFGCGLVFTEVITAEGILRRSPQTMRFLESLPEERPVAAHIYGSNPDSMAGAAQIIESLGRFDLIDINCGCPVPKVMRKGAGAALMREPAKIRTIVQAISQATLLPVTVKTRLGISRELFNISEVAHAAEEGGASAIFLHARFASDKHSGPADWKTLKRIQEERSIPVIGNGGITQARHATDMLQQTGVDGVMVGRAAIGNPWIFREIHSLWTGRPYHAPSREERRKVIAEHLRRLYTLTMVEHDTRKPQRQATERDVCRRFRGHLVAYLSGMRGLRTLRQHLMKMDSIEAVMAAVDEVLNNDG
ncbi:MAG: tRNA dihydrouridine synthase DusB [Chloroflexota bacterium]|nr:tRNA dihydrouridine synthase DusB [Chloroflexota bacterium]